jgi:hypothetical protein
MIHDRDAPPTARIVDFLCGIGIEVIESELGGDTFLPGLRLDAGRLLMDPERLTYPGDLLHEGGHVAVAPAWARPSLTGSVDVPGLDMDLLEKAVVPWSYAAALAIGIAPAVVFHEGGYRGKSEGLLRTFAVGVYPGANLLIQAGMCLSPSEAAATGAQPYPHMLRWLRA